MIAAKDARTIADILAGIGDPIRMVVFHHLTSGPHFVGQLAELLGIPMVNMSHHLGVMRAAGIVEHAKKGRMVMYSLNPDIYKSKDTSDTIGELQAGQWHVTIVKPNSTTTATKKATARS